jgi:hypothetical protein
MTVLHPVSFLRSFSSPLLGHVVPRLLLRLNEIEMSPKREIFIDYPVFAALYYKLMKNKVDDNPLRNTFLV